MQYKVIGIAGPARVGKDTAADYIIKHANAKIKKTSFADPIKIMLGEGLGLTPIQLYGSHKEIVDHRYGCSPRHMMQSLGTEWGRNVINQNIWVNALKSRVESLGGNWVLPDVRFESEADFVRSNGFMIHISGRESIASKHQSESGIYIAENDIVVYNKGTLKEYEAILSDLVRKYIHT